jgi:HSP20 family protein
MNIRLRQLDEVDTFEVDTPSAAISLLRPWRGAISLAFDHISAGEPLACNLVKRVQDKEPSMSQVAVKTISRTNQALHRSREFMNTLQDKIRRRAYYVFRQKGCRPGHELEDWEEAERELVCRPPSELVETNDEVRIRAVVPGFSARALAVDVLPNSITIEGQVKYAEHAGEERVHFTEFGEKPLMRQFDLPARIDPNEVTATLEDGVLQITAKKAAVTIAPMIAEVKTRRTAA